MKKESIFTIQITFAAVVSYLSNKLGLLFPVLMLLMLMMVSDYISGMIASKKESIDDPDNPEKGWSSKKGKIGIFKKVGYLLVIGVAMAVDYLIYNVAGSMGIQMPASTFFGLLTAVWFILNELLSILENAGRMGAPLPDFLRSIIGVLKSSVEKSGNENTNEEDDQD